MPEGWWIALIGLVAATTVLLASIRFGRKWGKPLRRPDPERLRRTERNWKKRRPF